MQALSVTYRDMISQADADALNAQVKAILDASFNQVYAENAIRQVGTANGYVFVDTSDDNHVELWRNVDGKYTTVWFESEFGQAISITNGRDYDSDAIGFDTQTLMWDEVNQED